MSKPAQEPAADALPDLLPIARRFLELQQEHGGMLADVIDRSNRRLFDAGVGCTAYSIDVLRLVAAAVSLAGWHGYTPDQVIAGWTEWNQNRLDLENCPECGLEHERRLGCPPQERRPEKA